MYPPALMHAPFDLVRDIEFDEPDNATINHGRFHTMTAYGHDNQMTPCDLDLFATLTSLCHRFGLDYGMLHAMLGEQCVAGAALDRDHPCPVQILGALDRDQRAKT